MAVSACPGVRSCGNEGPFSFPRTRPSPVHSAAALPLPRAAVGAAPLRKCSLLSSTHPSVSKLSGFVPPPGAARRDTDPRGDPRRERNGAGRSGAGGGRGIRTPPRPAGAAVPDRRCPRAPPGAARTLLRPTRGPGARPGRLTATRARRGAEPSWQRCPPLPGPARPRRRPVARWGGSPGLTPRGEPFRRHPPAGPGFGA